MSDAVVRVPDSRLDRTLRNGWTIAGFALLLLLVLAGLGTGSERGSLGGGLLVHPTWSAPTRDPAWYTWRANLIMGADPGSIVQEWGPVPEGAGGVFSGGYRVTVPLAGALVTRVAGTDLTTFSAFLMIGVPVLAGLALGAAGFRSRGDPLIVPLSMLAAAALFLTTPYVGYLDNITMLFLLCAMMAFVPRARESWGARSALFLLGVASAFTHPTTCILFGLSLMAVFGWHLLTSRFRFGEALRADAPMLWSVGLGMIVGLAFWVVPIWGHSASFADAALPPPYTKRFFLDRLGEWVGSMRPVVTVPLIAIAIAAVVVESRRRRRPADPFSITAIWWLFPLVGTLTFLVAGEAYEIAEPGSPVVPYYRFINATAAPIALAGLGAYVAIRWLSSGARVPRTLGAAGALVIVGALGWVAYDGLTNRWTKEDNQWIEEEKRIALAAVDVVIGAAGERPNVLVVNFTDGDNWPEFRTNTGYGWAKTYTNVFRTGIPADSVRYSATYFGRLEDYLADRPSAGRSGGYETTSELYLGELRERRDEFAEPEVAFLIGDWYGGDVDREAALASGIEIGPDVVVLPGEGRWTPPEAVIEAARAAAEAERLAIANHPGPLGDPLHLLRVLAGLFALGVLPGLIAAPFFELRDAPSRIALVPATSIVLTLLSGIALLSVWRGPLTTTKGWATVALATAVALGLRLGRGRLEAALTAFGGFFNRMFAVFSNTDYATLMGVQFLVQGGQGVIQGAIGKAIAFGGQEGFDVQNVPSAGYLLRVILFLYVPYTFLSPFIGVFIDRFERRRVVWWANLIAAGTAVAVSVPVLLSLGADETTEGNAAATAALIVGLLVAQAVVRVILAVKSAAIPDVLFGKDLLQGNGLSQAGGAVAQIVGIAFAVGAGAVLPAGILVAAGCGVLVGAAFVARRLRHVEARQRETTFAREASQVVRNIAAGLREVAGRAPAALGLSSFQMLRYQFWGFGLFVFALYVKNLVEGGTESQIPTAISGGVGLAGGILGLVLAQKLKDRVPPIRLLLASMTLLGLGTLAGSIVSLPGFAAMLFLGFFSFFLGKISVDTIVQQSMPDDFRGRAFALFDIAYNLGFIVPAFVLSMVWVEGDAGRTRAILAVSGAAFLALTALVAAWARRIRDQLAPQDDLVGTV
jgi:MFS family permease